MSPSTSRSTIWRDIGMGVAITLAAGSVGAVLFLGGLLADRLSPLALGVIAVVIGVAAGIWSSRSPRWGGEP